MEGFFFPSDRLNKCNKRNSMRRKERYEYVLNYFRERMPKVTTELEFGSVFQLLVATVLSAQCTDKRINQVTPELFRRFPDARILAQAEVDEVLEYVKSVSYPNSKARHLVELSRMIVIQAVAYGRSAIAVDTHVYRVSHRMGLVAHSANTPAKVEEELRRNIPEADRADAHHWLLLHGRYICQSRQPKCASCQFADICPKILDGSKVNR